MTTIDSFSVENIETKLMSVLYTNIDTCFNQFTLFDKLIKEKFPENYNTIINPAIKAKFLLVLRNLTSRFDDIKVEKKDNIYSITCFSDKNNLSNIKNYVPEIKTEYKSDSNSDSNSNSNSYSIPIPNLNPEYSDLINYIIENNLSEDMNYVDPFDGNTIFHDLVATNNIDKNIEDLDNEMLQISIKLENEKKLNKEMSELINNLQNTQNGSEILIDDSKTKYNIQYYKNVEIFIGILILSGLLTKLVIKKV
jgi:hypothetical protein